MKLAFVHLIRILETPLELFLPGHGRNLMLLYLVYLPGNLVATAKLTFNFEFFLFFALLAVTYSGHFCCFSSSYSTTPDEVN